MKVHQKLMIILFCVCSLSALPAVYADDAQNSSDDRLSSPDKRREWMDKKIQEIYGQLNLNEDQKKQLDVNKAQHRDKMKGVFDRMRSARNQLNQELMKSDLDMTKVNEIQTQIKSLQAEMSDDRLSSILEVKKILTPEQFGQFISLIGKHRAEDQSMKDK